MKKEITYKTLENFSKGIYSWNDYLEVKHWITNIHDEKEAKEYLEKQWDAENSATQPDERSLRHIFYEVEHQIILEEKRQARKTKWLIIYKQAAAVLLIPLLIFTAWYLVNNKHFTENSHAALVEINAPEGARTRFTLPDGTAGWLNGGSVLQYNPVFKTRHVILEGEAWFDVKHNETLFTVNTNRIDIHVLGTQFNVMAYPDVEFTVVVLENGKVEVGGTQARFEKTLAPGDKLTFFPGENKYRVQQVETEPYTAWKDGYLLIDNETLYQALARIERWYNADIEIRDETLKNYRFKATFQDEPLEEVLRLMALTTPMEYTIEKREIGADSLYEKKRVIIKRKQ